MIKSALMVGAHPDDETILAGGTLALLAAGAWLPELLRS